MTVLLLDIETFSPVPIEHGVHRYAEQAEILLTQYAIDDGEVEVWDRTEGKPMPDTLWGALADKTVEIVAHNASFERTLFRHKGSPIERDAARDIQRWHCTMARANAHSLPGSLGTLCDIMGVPQDMAKDKAGKKLMLFFCKPRPKNQKLRRATRHTHPQEWEGFKEYARLDVVSMRELYKKLPRWNYKGFELELWRLDQAINERGIPMDTDLANAALRAIDRAQAKLTKEVQEATDGEVMRATQRDVLLAYLDDEFGIMLPDLKASTVERFLKNEPDVPRDLRELLEIRLQATMASTAKYKRVIQATSSDGRLRGGLQWRGALRTGRWAGRIFQPQNLPSRGLLPYSDIAFGIECMLNDCEDLIFENVMHLCQSAVRGVIKATEGNKLCVADLANIEGRDQAWIAGETWKLKAFQEYDTLVLADGGYMTWQEWARHVLAGDAPALALDKKGEPLRKGHDLYKLAYAKAFGADPTEVDKDQRQIGKVMELFLGYEGGVGAYVIGAMTYGFDVEQLGEMAWPLLPRDLRDEAEEFLAWAKEKKRPRYGLSDRAFIVCDTFKRGWRQAHPNITRTWKLLAETVRQAINCPGVTLECGRLKIRRDGTWLRIGLPSGRALCYPGIQLDPKDDYTITYMGVHQYTRQWGRQKTYGGKLFENVCQAIAADVMAANMPRIEEGGYDIFTSVHDELPTEAPDSPEFSGDKLAALLATNPSWALDMPLAAAGFEAYRYRKD